MSDEQNIDTKALLLRIEALERKVGIWGFHKFIDTDDFETFVEEYTAPMAFIECAGMDVFVGAMIGLKQSTLLKIKNEVSKRIWTNITTELKEFVRNGSDNEFYRKTFFEKLNRAIADGKFWYYKPDKNFNREESAKEFRLREEARKQEEEAAEFARQERIKHFETWRKEVFDQLEKA